MLKLMILDPKIQIEDPEHILHVPRSTLLPYPLGKCNSFQSQNGSRSPKPFIYYVYYIFLLLFSFWVLLTISFSEHYKQLWAQRSCYIFFAFPWYILCNILSGDQRGVDLLIIIVNRILSYTESRAAVHTAPVTPFMSDQGDSSTPLNSFKFF